MALIKEPYGLVYNTDGSLCTTVRPDQTPFPGVNSFAVETATENLIGHTNGRFNSVTGEGTTPPTVELVSMKTPWGNEAWKVTIPANNDTAAYYGCRAITNSFPVTAGTYYSYFTYVLFEGSLQPKDIVIYPTGVVGMTDMALDSSKNIGSWQYFFRENAVASLTGYDYLTYYASTTSTVARTFYVAVGQFEQKPFVSSFVVGSRPSGRLVIPVEDLKFDIANDDWVISYWKYPVATRYDTQNDYNLCSLGQASPKGYIVWGKESGTNKYYLNVNLNDATYIYNISNNTFNPTDYFYHWHYEVVKKQGKVLSYYVDGVKQCELIIPADKELRVPFDVGLSLGGDTNKNIFIPDNALIAAPYYGYNNATWTDEYIREVYEAKIPFPVQSQLSIY